MWVIVRGGLGNQMFQVAFATALAERFAVRPRFVDLSEHARVARRWELGCFGIEPAQLSDLARLGLVACARTAHYWQKLKLPGRFAQALIEAPASPPSLAQAPRLVSGYWQNPRLFAGSAPTLRKLFALSTPGWQPMAAASASCPTVAVHVRRGDYASDPTARSVHLVCDENWYRQAWDVMRAAVPQARALVFSDDIEWARGHLALVGEVDYVAGAPDAAAWVDLARMSQCDHFIISNSSYSWWAAWLGALPAKRVIAPRYWFRGRETAVLGICPEDWMLL
jgi:hypothetical protein